MKINKLTIQESFLILNKQLIDTGISVNKLKKTCVIRNKSNAKCANLSVVLVILLAIVISIYNGVSIFEVIIAHLLGTRCILPNNYFVWEATRPISDCQFCLNVSRPIILANVSREEFAPYAYTSKPVIIKNAVKHWRASSQFNFNFLKELYDNTEGAYQSVEEDCQFLHFHSDFTTLRDVFSMTEARAKFLPGEKPWYVGWCNCNPLVLNYMRQFYPIPHFLPLNSELSNREYIFMGYDEGATMHLDFISRLMWQAQLLGNKTWNLVPSPECESTCQSFSFYVEPGDAMLLDTRVWYHGTKIAPGEFSLTIQSEYS